MNTTTNVTSKANLWHMFLAAVSAFLGMCFNENVATVDLNWGLLWVLAPVAAAVFLWRMIGVVRNTPKWYDNALLAIMTIGALVFFVLWVKNSDTTVPLEAIAWGLAILASIALQCVTPNASKLKLPKFSPRVSNPNPTVVNATSTP